MNDYAEHTRALKIHLKTLGDCLLHDDLSEVNTLLKSMRRHLDCIEEWVNTRSVDVIPLEHIWAKRQNNTSAK